MNNQRRFVFTAALAVIVIAVLLLSGAGATAYASQASLPGDALFPVKTSLEQTQSRLTLSAYQRAQLHLRFAQRRLDEINQLMRAGRYEDVKVASAEFEYYVGQALQSLQAVMAGDPARAAKLTEQISAAMLAYVDALKVVWVQVPDNVRPSVMQAILAAQEESDGQGGHSEELEFTGVVEAIGSDSWIIGGTAVSTDARTEIKGHVAVGNLVKVYLLASADGSLIARQIELHDGDDSQGIGNDNQADDQDNANDNHDNANDNGNDNGDDSNDNANDNGDDSNENVNDNGNDNVNDNDDEIGNDNHDNANDNGDESNDNGDETANDNGDEGGNDNEHSGENDNGDAGSDNGGEDGGGD